MRQDPERFVTFVLGTFMFVFYGGLGFLTIRIWRRTKRFPLLVFTGGVPGEIAKGLAAFAWPIPVLAWAYCPAAFRWIPHLRALENWAGRMTGLLLLCAGASIASIAYAELGERWTVGVDERPAGEPVMTGIYASIRHPVYTAMLLTTAGIFLLAPNAMFAMLFVGAWLLSSRQAAAEEEFLGSRWGALYRDYAARTGRFLPRF
ncbi:MAG: isoprenylcysteine carboxylmethyltransferase family protein [Proteobacteria bacterium]|nr:isoprenylcysteine carboxylmethyltransferase family protein [Pseudomonadota bacterium]